MKNEQVYSILKKLLLAAGSLVMISAIGEILFRIIMPIPAPMLMRDGIFMNVLPLVNGRPTDRGSFPQEGSRLPDDPEPDEVRIFVFGESSIEGWPWGPIASPPTMLYDQLAAEFLLKKITVVNMGRASAFTMDTLYHLISIRKFKPDYIIFYTGINNRYDLDREMCFPVSHPWLYGAWRYAVAHSHMLWTVRAIIPDRLQFYQKSQHSLVEGISNCELLDATWEWTKILAETAASTGATVIITSPIRSVFSQMEREYFTKRDLPLLTYLAQLSDSYRKVLVCKLTPGCDFTALVDASENNSLLRSIRDAWKNAAQLCGAEFIDFFSLLQNASPGNVLGPPFIVDDVHMSLEGNWLLANTWFQKIEGFFNMNPVSVIKFPAIPDLAQYVAAFKSQKDKLHTHEEILLVQGLRHLKVGMALIATTFLSQAVDIYGNQTAMIAMGWLKKVIGMPHGLPPDLSDKLSDFEPGRALEDLFKPKEDFEEEFSSLIRNIQTIAKESTDRSFNGFVVETVNAYPSQRVAVSLRRDSERIELILGEKTSMDGHFLEKNLFALCYRKETPVDTTEKNEAVHEFADYVEEHLAAMKETESR
jgi:hypothetical protein